MMAAGTAHRAREHSTVTRSDQAELRRDGRRNGSGHKILSNGARTSGLRENHAAGRARTGDFEIFSLALSQTELPRLARTMKREGKKVSARRTDPRFNRRSAAWNRSDRTARTTRPDSRRDL